MFLPQPCIFRSSRMRAPLDRSPSRMKNIYRCFTKPPPGSERGGRPYLIIGSPNYLSDLTASFRALYERLIFQNLTYSMDPVCCNERKIPVLLIMTSNAPDTMYTGLIRNYQQVLSTFVGPTEILISGDTQQLKDYSKTDWPWYFNAEAKYKRHETVFPEECKKAFQIGAELFK